MTVVCEEYRSHEGDFANPSDHAPVSAIFSVPVVLGKPKLKDKKKEVSIVLRNLKWEINQQHLDPRIEPESQICVTILHKYLPDRVTSPPAPLSKTAWPEPIKITASRNEAEVRTTRKKEEEEEEEEEGEERE